MLKIVCHLLPWRIPEGRRLMRLHEQNIFHQSSNRISRLSKDLPEKKNSNTKQNRETFAIESCLSKSNGLLAACWHKLQSNNIIRSITQQKKEKLKMSSEKEVFFFRKLLKSILGLMKLECRLELWVEHDFSCEIWRGWATWTVSKKWKDFISHWRPIWGLGTAGGKGIEV